MIARITLIKPPRAGSNPFLDHTVEAQEERNPVIYNIEVSCLAEAREYYDQAVVMDLPSVRGLLLRSIEEIK